MLDALGVGAALAGKGCEIRHIRVSDGLAPGKLDFIPDADDGALGTMYENRLLRRALFESARGAARIDLRMKTRAAHVERGAGGVTARLSIGQTDRKSTRLNSSHSCATDMPASALRYNTTDIKFITTRVPEHTT